MQQADTEEAGSEALPALSPVEDLDTHPVDPRTIATSEADAEINGETVIQANASLESFASLSSAEDTSEDASEQDESERDFVGIDPEVIRIAAQTAVEDAIAMKRSDSILSTESNEESSNSDDSEVPLPSPDAKREVSRASARYMEEASFEAAMVRPGTHRVGPSGRKLNLDSASEIVTTEDQDTPNLADEDNDSQTDAKEGAGERRNSERAVFRASARFNGDSAAILETVISGEELDIEDESEHDIGSVVEILQSIGMELPSDGSGYPEEVVLLHQVFEGFCTPPLEIESVGSILRAERDQSNDVVKLPADAVVENASPALIKLLGTPLLLLPSYWSKSFFRILIRLLTGDSDAEYDMSILTACPWYEETFGVRKSPLEAFLSRRRTESTTSLKRETSFSDASLKRMNEAKLADLKYTMVRFQRRWRSARQDLLAILQKIITLEHTSHLEGPVARLLGLVCTAGVSVDQLRRILNLATNANKRPLTALHLIRALRVSAAGSSRSTMLVGKASPSSFFSFTSGPGIVRPIKLERSSWPFKNDFGMALWFRPEKFNDSSTLFKFMNQAGDGAEVSLTPVKTKGEKSVKAMILAISIREGGKVVENVEISQCILHERVWYHVAVRHTRSRMKGVFSLGSREQLSVMLDGKLMLKESVKFPKIRESECKSLTMTFGSNFDGQTGSLYVFNENVSDATLKALYEVTAETTISTPNRTPTSEEWDMKHSAIVRKSKVLDLEMKKDDMEDLVVSQPVNESKEPESTVSIVDLADGEEAVDNRPLSKSSFTSRLYIAWDPRRTEGTVALELHIGAHARINPDHVQAWNIGVTQDVFDSIGGIQALLPLFRNVLSGESQKKWPSSPEDISSPESLLESCAECWAIPDILQLLATLVHDHGENSREMLRSGFIDMLEHLLYTNKSAGEDSNGFPASSLMGALSIFPALSSEITNTILSLRTASSHYIGLESKVFSKLLFNVPLWLSGHVGCSLFVHLLPLLSSISRDNPEKVRDCVGVKPMIELIVELTDAEDIDDGTRDNLPEFERDNRSWNDLCKPLTCSERRRVMDILFATVLNVTSVGSTVDEVSFIVASLSRYLEYEWDLGAKEASEGKRPSERSGIRLERYRFTLRMCTIILLLLQSRPKVPKFLENFITVCGGVQGGVSWILSAMVNSYCDRIRAFGIRCVVAYIEQTANGPNAPLAFHTGGAQSSDGAKFADNFSLQENTLALISNVGQGIMNSNVGKGLAAMGPSAIKSGSSQQVTARVVYKLLWHLLKSHRYDMGVWTQSSLLTLVFERSSDLPMKSLTAAQTAFLLHDEVFDDCLKFNLNPVSDLMADLTLGAHAKSRGVLSMNALMRLLRFLPESFMDQWLSDLLDLSSRNSGVLETITTVTSWQPCLFQMVSELTESIASRSTLSSQPSVQDPSHEDLVFEQGQQQSEVKSNGLHTLSSQSDISQRSHRLDSSLELYAALLAYRIRCYGETGIRAVEEAASLQRVCVNGQQVFILLLTKLLSNLHLFGVISMETLANSTLQLEGGNPNILLKKSAKLVVDALKANTSRAITTSTASDCWRCIQHLSAVTVAIATQSGFGVSELLDSHNRIAISSDQLSGGMFGIRLDEQKMNEIMAKDFIDFQNAKTPLCNTKQEVSVGQTDTNRRLCVNIAAQLLSLLDVFIFPEHVEAGQKVSQLHGLSLVRKSESRCGPPQGPLLASLVRLSLLLLGHLEPCSTSLLQCCSRLRCFVHWMLDLMRESEALEGYSAGFNKLTALFERLLLSIVLLCHRTLWRCKLLSIQMESTPFEEDFKDKQEWKVSYRRLMRVSSELREILVIVLQHRSDVPRRCFLPKVFDSFKVAIQENYSQNAQSDDQNSREENIRKLLRSEWVANYHSVKKEENNLIPEQLMDGKEAKGTILMKDLFVESREIESAFESSLNDSFEKYLENQRTWAETGAVRDLEFEGDTTLKKHSGLFSSGVRRFANESALKSNAANVRWQELSSSVTGVWEKIEHWQMDCRSNRMGRRTLLVKNQNFNDHHDASYELLMGLEREKEEKEREERLRKKEELAQLMKRNSEAFVPVQEELDLDEDLDRIDETEIDETEADESLAKDADFVMGKPDSDQVAEEQINSISNGIEPDPVSSPEANTDAWMKAFIWSDGESTVASFEPVVFVSLRYHVEGRLVLTTHGLYFHPTAEPINAISRQIFGEADDSIDPASIQDRRWRLSRLTEVHGRRYMLLPQALELFFSDGHEIFLHFATGNKDRNRFYAKLRNSCRIPMLFSPKSLNPRTVFKRSKLTELWRKRMISNFDYLMALNRMAGRTFNDIAQYPVFPWILADYSSEKLDLSDSQVYRDLTKPVGALNPDRLSQLIERYNELEQFGFAENERFLYGSHYSSPGVILHFLIRQEPFTSMAIDLQSGRFDCPDRLFFDIAQSWKSCNTSSSDVKELIPEFFTLPEMMLNQNQFPLGKTQRGVEVDNVALPPWAKGSAQEFVRIHRLALESEIVSRNLHHWIDLIFGYKQRGPAAEAAHNVFHHLSYEGAVDLDKITNELDRQAAESHIQNFGQTPSQLLVKEGHPERYAAEECWSPLINNLSSAVRLKCHTPAKQYGKKGGSGSAIKIDVYGDTVSVIYSDLKMGTFRWTPKSSKNRLKPERLRALPSRPLSCARSVMKRGSAAPQALDDSTNALAVGNWSFAVTVGGYEREQLRRKTVMPSRLASAKDALYAEAASLVISCGYWDNSIKVHSTDNWKLECSKSGGHNGPIRCLAIGSDGGLLLSGGQDCTVRVWVVDHLDMAVALSDGYVQTAVGHSVDADQVLSCCHVLWGHETPISCLAACSDLDIAVSGSIGGKVCLHSIRRGEFIRAIVPPSASQSTPAITKLAVDRYGRIVVHMADRSLHTFTTNGARLCSVAAGERINDMKIAGEVLITGGDRCHVYIRDLVTLKVLSGLDLSRHGPIRCITLTSEDLNLTQQNLFIGSDDGTISIVDREDE